MPVIIIVATTTVFTARDVVQSLGAAIGNLVAMSRSTDMATRKRPDKIAAV